MTVEDFKNQRAEIIQELLSVNKTLKYVDIYDRTSAIIGKRFAILFQSGRGETDITYLTMNNDELIEYPFDSFITSSFDANDRKGIVHADGFYEGALTDLKIIVRGLMNHWTGILNGSMDWVSKYERSRYYYEPRPTKLSEGKVVREKMSEFL